MQQTVDSDAANIFEITQEPTPRHDTLTNSQNDPAITLEAPGGAFDLIDAFNEEQESADRKLQAEANAKKETLDIYDAAIVRMADENMTWSNALSTEMDAREVANYEIDREGIFANIAKMVADKNERVQANRTISNEAVTKITSATEQGKHNRELYELSDLFEIVTNLRIGKKINGLKEQDIINQAVDLYLSENGHVAGYDTITYEQKKMVHDAYVSRLVKAEEMQSTETAKDNKTTSASNFSKEKNVLSTVVKFVKDYKEVVVAACGVAVAVIAKIVGSHHQQATQKHQPTEHVWSDKLSAAKGFISETGSKVTGHVRNFGTEVKEEWTNQFPKGSVKTFVGKTSQTLQGVGAAIHTGFNAAKDELIRQHTERTNSR